jgi:hypothetical protein
MLIRESRHVFKNFMYLEGISLKRVLLDDGQKVEDILICKSCKQLVMKPFHCQKCKVLFCQSCAMRYETPTCEICKSDKLTENIQQLFRIMLSKYKVNCKHKSEGCDLVLYYENLEEHEDICLFERMYCIYPDCKEKIEKKSYIPHTKNCIHRLINCEFCSRDFKFNDIENHYINCEMKMVQCYGCRRQVLNKFLNEHIDICDEIKLVCERCGKILKKAEIGNHNEIDCVASILKNFRDTNMSTLSDLAEQLKTIKTKIEANDKMLSLYCHKCKKVSCEIALKGCDLCKTKLCNFCAKDLLKACKSCGKLFCPTCFAALVQHKSCLSCGESVLNTSGGMNEAPRLQPINSRTDPSSNK